MILSEDGSYNLSIISANGKISTIFTDKLLLAGTHQLKINFSEMPPGVYIARLAGKSIINKRFVIE